MNNSSALEHYALVEYDQSINFHNELNNEQIFNIDLDDFNFENIDLTSSIDIEIDNSEQNKNETSLLNSFDLNDPKLFSFLNEIDFLSNIF